MNEEIALKVEHVSKTFKLPHEKSDSIKGAFVNMLHPGRTYETQQVLKDVSFEVKKGDFFGIVGRNGSGKSTLLKMMAGIYKPTKGQIHVNGKLTPFIELGVGFNPELTGRENVFLNGALLGFSRKEMQAMYQEIVDFSELERFMDQKLKNYSSGMQVRLAFSIAIKAKNEILIFDEVLAVGDEAFQRKCLDVFEKYRAEGQTVILVTHEMENVRKFCNNAILLHDGAIVESGNPRKVAEKYSMLNQQTLDATAASANSTLDQNSITIETFGLDGKKKNSFKAGESISAKLHWKPTKDLRHVVVNIFKLSGEHITGIRHTLTDEAANAIGLKFSPNVNTGKYFFTLQALSEKGETIGSEQRGAEFIITSQYISGINEWSGLFSIQYEWEKLNS